MGKEGIALDQVPLKMAPFCKRVRSTEILEQGSPTGSKNVAVCHSSSN